MSPSLQPISASTTRSPAITSSQHPAGSLLPAQAQREGPAPRVQCGVFVAETSSRRPAPGWHCCMPTQAVPGPRPLTQQVSDSGPSRLVAPRPPPGGSHSGIHGTPGTVARAHPRPPPVPPRRLSRWCRHLCSRELYGAGAVVRCGVVWCGPPGSPVGPVPVPSPPRHGPLPTHPPTHPPFAWKSAHVSVVMVRPGGTESPIRDISARLAPLPPSCRFAGAVGWCGCGCSRCPDS